ncbi:TetR-like C-terminal domain-containing protein [Methylobacterium sp. JK268]
MGIADRKGRQRAEREQRIVAAARAIAESEGWNAVTIRRLAEEIEYSQPVLYGHFENRDAIVAAVAVAGFRDMAAALRRAAAEARDRRGALDAVAAAYLGFGRDHPAVYEAMFTLPTGLAFGEAGTHPVLKDAFAALAAVVTPSHTDRNVATETFWAALHGLAALDRAGRIRVDARADRVALLVRWLLDS